MQKKKNNQSRGQELRHLHAKANKLRGQNFLQDETVIRRIVEAAEIEAGQYVLEIGPGLGALTRHLAEKPIELTAVEIEPEFALRLKAEFINQPRVQIVQQDAREFDYATFADGKPYKLLGNLPYNITTPLVKLFLNAGGNWQCMVLLLQKEAAVRIAQGRGRSNSPLTILAEYYAESTVCFDVPPHCFVPAPAVTSAVLKLQRRTQPPVAEDIDQIMQLAEAGFANRRKTLLNSLSSSALGQGREFWQQAMQECGIAENSRAEDLHLNEYAALSAWCSRQ